MTKTAVLFRTHIWDRHVAAAADALRRQSDGADFFVLADETRGPLPVPDAAKISHTLAGFAAMGLETTHHGLWHNGDYPIYTALERLPDHDVFVMAEFDVRTTAKMAELGRAAAGRGIDLIAHGIERATSRWAHTWTCAGSYDVAYKALIPFVLVSRRLARRMLERRLELTGRLRRGEISAWPYCEAFFPSEAMADDAFRSAELSEFGDVSRYDWMPPMPEQATARLTGPAFLHPVLDDARYIASRLRIQPRLAFAICEPGSEMAAEVEGCDPAVIAAAVQPICKQARDYMAISRLRHRFGLPPLADGQTSVAFAKPATQSSVSQFSQGATPEQDAAGGNDGIPTGNYSFHTGTEEAPWWRVDLLRPHRLDRVRLLNRPGHEHRARRFSILASPDGEAWMEVLRKDDDSEFGGRDGAPFEASLPPGATARFVKVRLHGFGCLHLDQIELFGAPMPAAPSPQ